MMRAAERVLALAADRGSGHPGGRYCYGSGFLVAGRTVLTCAHVVAGAHTVLLDDAAGRHYTGRVVRIGDPGASGDGGAPDLAIVEIDDPQVDAPAFPVARIDRTGAGVLESVRVVGWPRFMDGRERRSTFSSAGAIDVLSRVRDGLLRVDVSGSPPAPTGVGSPWQGMSGAPVIVDGHLAAVVTTHGLPEGPTALTAVPVTAVESTGRGVPAPDDWWPALGQPATGPVQVIRPGPVGPACVVGHDVVVRSLQGYRASLMYDVMPYVAPADTTPWHPGNLWRRLLSPDGPGAVLVSGHGGMGKTRTLLEVCERAVDDGWTVLHVRAGKAGGVVDHLSVVLRESFTPVLVVLDYLNLSLEKDLDLPQMLALVQQYRRGTTPHAAVLASARTGWLLSPAHARDVAALERIHLVPASTDLTTICESLARTAAPRATETLGLEAVLGYAGSARPVLTLLAARQIEQRIAQGRPPLPRPTMDATDLRQWLELRLAEDQLVPALDSPASMWGPAVDVHIQAAAALLLAAPADEQGLLDVAEQILGDRPSAANVLRLLVEMGWIVKYAGTFDTVHDVVTDFLTDSVLFWSTTRTIRPAITGQLLNAVAQRTDTFDHALTALGRLADDLDVADQSATELSSEADRWLQSNLERVSRLLLDEPAAGAWTASALLRSGLLTDGRQQYWTALCRPLLTALGRRAEAYPLLLVTVQAMPAQAPEWAVRLADDVLAWLTGRPLTGVDRLLRLLLERSDLPVTQAEAAVQLAIAWLNGHARDRHSDFLLSALLSREGMADEPHGERLIGLGLEWLTAHSSELGASFLLRTMGNLWDRLGDAVPQFTAVVSSWIGAHGESMAASFVLRGLLARPDLPAGLAPLVLTASRRWVVQYGRRPEASFVLAPLLGRADLTEAVRTEAMAVGKEWLEANPDDPGVDHLLRRMLVQPAPAEDVRMVVLTATRRWLNGERTEESATSLLQAVLQADEIPGDLREAALDMARRWLAVHGTRTSARFLLQSLMSAADAPLPVRTAAFDTSRAWLTVHGTGESARVVLESILQNPEAPADLRSLAFTTARAWLPAHANKYPARQLLKLLLSAADAPMDVRESAFDAVGPWLEYWRNDAFAGHLLRALVRAMDPADGLSRPARIRQVEQWSVRWILDCHPSTGAQSVILWLLRSQQLPAGERSAILQRAVSWLENHAAASRAGELIGLLLAHPDFPRALAPPVFRAAGTWLTRDRPHQLAARHLIRTLYQLPPEHHDDVDRVIGAHLSAVARRVGDLQTRFSLATLLEQPGLRGANRDATFRLARDWLEQHGHLANANVVILPAAQRDDLAADEVEFIERAALTWLDRHASDERAERFLEVFAEVRSTFSVTG